MFSRSESAWSVVGTCCCGLFRQLRRIGFIHVRLEDRVTINSGDDALLRALVAAGDENERGQREEY